jgi:hypothetical protein
MGISGGVGVGGGDGGSVDRAGRECGEIEERLGDRKPRMAVALAQVAIDKP